ncbi:MAG: phosphoesterase [bacterium]|nr:phosphoesterase [bacterium]
MSSAATSGTGLTSVENFVVIMLENRSFDHILGNLYAEEGNVSPLGHPFDGLTGKESNKDNDGNETSVWNLDPADPYAYFTPKADPGEGFANTSAQLYGDPQIVKPTAPPSNSGFVTNYQFTLSWEPGAGYTIYPGAGPQGIMAMHTPKTLPVLSTLARQYAVCDRWFCSVPSETQPNRSFIHMATSEGLIKNNWNYQFTSKSIFGALSEGNRNWMIYSYGHKGLSMTRFDIKDILSAPDSNFGVFPEFVEAAKNGKLANYTFLEPAWGLHGNSMHPNYNVARGEQYLKEIYQAVVNSPQWDKTMLIITFDEHGGCYDHVAPPANAAPPDKHKATNGFDFTRFGVRVPTVLVSPLIQAGTVFRVPEPDNYQPGTGENPAAEPTPFDHTSILRTVERRFGLAPLTRRDAAAPDLAGVLTLDQPRTDNVLADVTPPTATLPTPTAEHVGVLQKALVTRATEYPDPREKHGSRDQEPDFDSGSEAMDWAASRWRHYRDYWSRR